MIKRYREQRGLSSLGSRLAGVFSFFILAWGIVSSPCSAMKDEILFMVHDAGETFALKPVFKVLDERKVPYQILASGKASDLLDGHHALSNTPSNAPLKILSGVGNLTGAQYEGIVTAHPQKVVFTSMSSRAHGDLANAFKKKGARVVAYYDNFDDVVGRRDRVIKEYVRPFLASARGLDGYVTPSSTTELSFKHLNAIRNEVVPITVLGQPSLESWQEAHQNTALKDQVAAEVLTKDMQQHPLLIFAGGYDLTYRAAFEEFIKGVKGTDFKVLVTPHPKTDGSVEASIVEEHADIGQVRIIFREQQEGGLSTMNLSTLEPTYLVCHKSTVCMQGLAVGIPALYMAEEGYSNFAIEAQMAPRVGTADELRKILSRKHDSKGVPHLEDYGIPSGSAEKIADYLQEALAKK